MRGIFYRPRYYFRHPVKFLSDLKWAAQLFYQRRTRGFDSIDVMNAGDSIANYALPIIKEFRKKYDSLGCPHGLPGVEYDDHLEPTNKTWDECQAIWIDILDRIIAGLELCNDDNDPTSKAYGSHNNHLSDEERNAIYESYCKIQKEGLELLGKWLLAIWN